jgi:hypothetical protein
MSVELIAMRKDQQQEPAPGVQHSAAKAMFLNSVFGFSSAPCMQQAEDDSIS